MSFQRELEVGIAAVRQAAKACRAVQRQITPDVLDKQDKSPVTVADFASQAIICQALAAAFPQDAMLAEEDAAALSEPGNAPFLDRILAEVNAAGVSARAATWPAGSTTADTPTSPAASGRSIRLMAPKASSARSSTRSHSP